MDPEATKYIRYGLPPRERNLAFLDLETTGFELGQEIVEIGVVRVAPKTWEVIEQFELKVKPKHLENADPESLKVIGFSEEAWQDALELNEALEILEEKCQGDILIGQNFSFDWSRLEKAYFEAQRPLPHFYYHHMDVKSILFYKYFKETQFQYFSLLEACKFFNIPLNNQHHALADAYATYLVFKKIMEDTYGNQG